MNRPVALVCYICGRQFGTKSLGIHVKACQKKWENEQNLKPPKERRPCPQPPQGFGQLMAKPNITGKDIQQFNGQSYDTFVQDALIQCEYCGRRFNPTSLGSHQKACKISPMIRKTYASKEEQSKNGEKGKIEEVSVPSKGYALQNIPAQQESMNLVPCRKCGRKFNADRLSKHEKVCKAESVKIVEKEQVPQKKAPPSKANQAAEKKAKWQIQHEQLQNAMKVVKQMRAVEASGGKLSDLPPPPRGNYDHYVECKYCGRKYAPDVAERHIPKCANIVNKPGGIQPSKIQEKYIQGTGSTSKPSPVKQATKQATKPVPEKPSPVATPTRIATKPMMALQKGGIAKKY